MINLKSILQLIKKLLGIPEKSILYYITGTDALPMPLSPEEEADAMRRLTEGDNEVKSVLIEHNLRLVVYIARKFDNTGVDTEDLMSDVLGTDPDLVSKNIENTVEKQLLWEAINKLSQREKTIMEMRFGLTGTEEKTQKEVADMMGISQSYISRLEKKIILRLKKEIAKAL